MAIQCQHSNTLIMKTLPATTITLLVKNMQAAALISSALLTASIVNAEDVSQVADGLSSDKNGWETSSLWSNNSTPSAGNQYYTNGHTLLSPNISVQSAGSTFLGSLTANSGTMLTIKNKTIVFSEDLTLGNSTLRNATNNGSNIEATISILGTLTISPEATAANSALIRGAYTGNGIVLNVNKLMGSGYLVIGETDANTCNLSVANASEFTGTIDFSMGTITLDSTLNAAAGTIVMSDSQANLVLASDLYVAQFTFGNVSLEQGTYTVAQLNEMFSTSVFSGSGVIGVSVIPEPQASTLLIVMCVALGWARRAQRTKP